LAIVSDMAIVAASPTRATGLGAKKLAQAQALLPEFGLDAWLTVVRESAERPDPNLRFFVEQDFTWSTFFLVTPDWSAALVATFDAPDLVRLGLFDQVATYQEGPRSTLLDLLDRRAPKRIGINVSPDDALADGLTAGLRIQLEETLAGTLYAGALVEAGGFLSALRAVKLPEELERIERAVAETEAMFDRVRDALEIGMTAREVAGLLHAEADRAKVRTAWPRHYCPTVTIGARAPVGHVGPGEEPIARGSIVHVDFGIVRDGYCSDLQRLWYVAGPGRSDAPEPVRKAYAAIAEAIELAARSLKAGTPGWEVDDAVRVHLRSRGFPEYGHALGHHLGRAVHDGGGVLGPRWERYGREPFEPVREGSVYTLEPSIHLPEHGLVSLEEDVVVEPRGARFLSRFPRELPVLQLP
jgi:Xaa-Pro dipeptidase